MQLNCGAQIRAREFIRFTAKLSSHACGLATREPYLPRGCVQVRLMPPRCTKVMNFAEGVISGGLDGAVHNPRQRPVRIVPAEPCPAELSGSVVHRAPVVLD